MSSSDALWVRIWEALATIGFLLVIVGVIIEGVEHFKKFRKSDHARKLHIEKIGWLILVVGLAMEFLGDHAAKRITDRESSRLNKEAGGARREAGDAIMQAASANARASSNELARVELEKQVLELELKLQRRRIAPAQMDKIVSTLRPLSKTGESVSVNFSSSDEDSEKYAEDFITLFKNSGYTVRAHSAVYFVQAGVPQEGVSIIIMANQPPRTALEMQNALKAANIDTSWYGTHDETNSFIVFIGKKPR